MTQGIDAVVFLDIDRVCNTRAALHRAVWGGRIETDPEKVRRAAAATLDPVLVGRVQRVCDATGAAVVLVSGWRRRMTCDEAIAALRAAGLTAPSLGCLVDAAPGTDTRRASTRTWLSQHPEVTRWVVLDDTRDHWCEPSSESNLAGGNAAAPLDRQAVAAWLEGHLVHPVDGVLDEDVEAAVRILSPPPRG